MNSNYYVVYLDVFFIINFIMDFVIIRITFKLLRMKMKMLRIIASAFEGAVYSIVFIVNPLENHFISASANVLLAIIMILTAFGYSDFRKFIKTTVFFSVAVFLCGGIMNALYYSTDFGVYANEVIKGNTHRGMKIRTFIFISVSTYFLLYVIRKIVFEHYKGKETIYRAEMYYRGKVINTMALYDTGNSLKEPLSGKNVQIAEYDILKPLLEGDETLREKICVIPFRSVGKENGVLYGIRIDKMEITVNEDSKISIKKSNNVSKIHKKICLDLPVIAIYKGKLSGSGEYAMILNREIFEDSL